MLTELTIRNFAIIDSLSVSLAEGFNVLSGETGAGKSIIVGALGLLLGERGSAEQVRIGADKAIVEGVFDASRSRAALEALGELGIDCDDGLVALRREVSSTGRSRAWINGFSVNVSTLAATGRLLASIHGQHEGHALVDSSSQRDILDIYSGAVEEAAAVRRLHSHRHSVDRRLEELKSRAAESAKKADYLRFLAAEIEGAKLVDGEEAKLDAEAARLEHASELASLAESALDLLNSDEQGAAAILSRMRRAAESIARIDPEAGRLVTAAESAEVIVDELARDLGEYANKIEVDPARLSRINERRATIFRITRKYGGSVASSIEALSDAREELAALDSSELDLAALETEKSAAAAALMEASLNLSRLRAKGGKKFGAAVGALLPALGMPNAKFDVAISPLNETGAGGAEDVTFLVEFNAGHGLRELSKVASGGELSRTMLAIKTELASLDRIPTLVFDEVDAGIGGQVAVQVGGSLRELAAHHQVLVITHLPQIAARAHRHLIVLKTERAGTATAEVHVVEGSAREEEITRMLSGNPASKKGRVHARELLEDSARQ